MSRNKLLRLEAVKDLTGLSRSSIYKFMDDGKFPKKINLGVRAVAWSESSIQDWIEGRIADSCSADENSKSQQEILRHCA